MKIPIKQYELDLLTSRQSALNTATQSLQAVQMVAKMTQERLQAEQSSMLDAIRAVAAGAGEDTTRLKIESWRFGRDETGMFLDVPEPLQPAEANATEEVAEAAQA